MLNHYFKLIIKIKLVTVPSNKQKQHCVACELLTHVRPPSWHVRYMIDGYLREIGAAMYAKLSRGHLTGLAPPISFYIPWQVMQYMACLCSSYGADIKQISPKTKKVGC